MQQKNKLKIFIAVALFMAICDQISKNIIDATLTLNKQLIVIPHVFSLEKVYNTGAAFSIMQNNTLCLVLIAVLTLVVIMAVLIKQFNKLMLCEFIAFGFITGGAIGNLADRVRFSHVIDFLQLDFINFPIFNFADIFINIGVIILIISILFVKNE